MTGACRHTLNHSAQCDAGLKPPREISSFSSADVTNDQKRKLTRHNSSHDNAIVPLSIIFKGQSMDRRQFLRAVSILGSCGFSSANKSFASQTADSCTLEVEAASNPDAEHSPKVGIVAIGSTGNWILNRLNGTLPQLHRCISVERGRLTIVKIDENNRVIRGGLWRNNRPAGWGSVEPTADQIAHSIEGMDQLFVLTDMSSSMELDVASVLAEISNRENLLMIGAVSNHFGYPKAYGRRPLQHRIEQLFQLGHPTISLCGGRNHDQYRWAGEVILEQLEAKTTFERLYRSTVTVLPQDDGQSFVSIDREGVRGVFSQKGVSGMVIGHGSANGPDGARLAAYRAISHPLFDPDRERPEYEVLVSIEAGPDRLKLREVNRVLGVIRDACPHCIQIVGALRNPLLKDDFQVTVVAPQAAWKNA